MHENDEPVDRAQREDDSPEPGPAPDGEMLGAQLQEAQAEIARLRDAQLRERADIENQRRRLTREVEQARRFANERLLRDLLPVCDALDRGLAAESPNADGLLEGMALTRKSLLKVLQDHGLERVEAMGKPFDPEYHEAMSMVEPGAGQQPETVVTVIENGYVLHQRLLRPARVIVTRGA